MCSKSGKGFVFTAEALFALICFGVFIASLSMVSFEDYGDVVLYKQASDYAQVAMIMHCEHDEKCLSELRSLLKRGEKGKCVSVTRTAVNENYEDVVFTLCEQ